MASDDLIELYLDRLAERGCTEATLDTNRRILSYADLHLPFGLDQSDEGEIRAFLFRRPGRQLARSSQRTYHVILNCFYDWATGARVLKLNPMDQIAAPKTPDRLPRVAEDDQVRWVLTEAVEPFRLWGTLAAYGNLRCIEVSRLHREHIGAEDIVVHRGKGDKPRVIPTHALVWAAVQDLPNGPITDCTPKQVSVRFWKYCVRHGVRELSMHRLRGWYATSGYTATGDVLAVQRNMGHKDPRTTAGYIRRSAGQARAVIEGLPTFGLSASTA